ncbi:hypothetical protein P389DRAFT_193903 [Cystobasidium minutum MCA 4210]|uniref:uncharacterized protein n=1 Tax=Cystobasidium minutum MCA 4210 TaxID=1397322 RepID=UPI0034CE71D9|eukprot:jgi/Rhomi1/193903/gm1.2117_g
MPGDPPSMDWKNKKASKVAQQAEAATGTSADGANPLSPSPASPSQLPPSSPGITNGGISTAGQQHQQAPVQSSGLSSMFGRNGSNGPTAPSTSNRLAAVAASESSGAAIGMSPIGFPLPADLPLPTGSSASAAKPKTFSYASVVGSSIPSTSAAGGAAQSPNTLKAAALPQFGSLTNQAAVRSPPVSAKSITSTSPSITSAHDVNPSSPSFVPRALQSPNANAATNGTSGLTASANNGMSTSVPSTFNMDKLQRNIPTIPSHGALPQAPPTSQQAGFTPGSYQRSLNYQPSPLAPPPLQHSHSHSSSIPSRSFLLNQAATASGSLSPSLAPGQHYARQPAVATSSPSTGVFGTSPFGNNAIFLSTSHEEDAGSFMARAASRAPGSSIGRGISPARPGFESRSFSSASRSKHGSSALADDDEDGTQHRDDDDNVLEEELVPSSLKHLLTPDEKARRDSRSGNAVKSGFFNPFNDDGAGHDHDDDDDFDQEVVAELRLRYSQSVPVAAGLPSHTAANGAAPGIFSQFNRAPGSPPTFVGHSPFSSGLARPAASGGDGPLHGSSSGALSSNLAKNLLGPGAGSAAQQGHRVERGFLMADHHLHQQQIGQDSTGLLPLGTSLPQGMAAGLSRLHMIPAGSEHTGYTPPTTSFVHSPSSATRSHFAAGAIGGGGVSGTQHATSASSPNKLHTSNSYLAPGSRAPSTSAAPGSSYGIKLPSLLHHQHPGVGSRKSSSSAGHHGYEGAQVHVGSPLARMEIHGHIGSGRTDAGQTHSQQHDASGQHHGSDGEEEDLVFDMDV